MCLGFLDSSGALIPSSYEVWKDDRQRDSECARGWTHAGHLINPMQLLSGTPTRVTRMSPTATTTSTSQDGAAGAAMPGFDQQFIVVASEKQCRVMSLPTQTCVYKQQITDTDYVIKAEIINLKGEWSGRQKLFIGSAQKPSRCGRATTTTMTPTRR